MNQRCEICNSHIYSISPTCSRCRIPEIKKEIKHTKKRMKEMNIRVISCFNGGLTNMERYWNSKLFNLKSLLLAYEAGQI